jgi:hypothetical protein
MMVQMTTHGRVMTQQTMVTTAPGRDQESQVSSPFLFFYSFTLHMLVSILAHNISSVETHLTIEPSPNVLLNFSGKGSKSSGSDDGSWAGDDSTDDGDDGSWEGSGKSGK